MKAKFMNNINKKYPIYVLSLAFVTVLYFSSNCVANGQVVLDPLVPGYAEIGNTLSAAGATVKLQAIDIESCTPSNVTTEVF